MTNDTSYIPLVIRDAIHSVNKALTDDYAGFLDYVKLETHRLKSVSKQLSDLQTELFPFIAGPPALWTLRKTFTIEHAREFSAAFTQRVENNDYPSAEEVAPYLFDPVREEESGLPLLDDKAVKKAVEAPFKTGDVDYVTLLETRIRAYALLWTSEGVFSPYFVVVNASLMGKSRLIRQLKRKGIFVIPICLRMAALDAETPAESLAAGCFWPPPTPSLVEWAKGWINDGEKHGGEETFIAQLCALFYSCLFHLAKWLMKQTSRDSIAELSEAWADYLDGAGGKEFWTSVYNLMVSETSDVYTALIRGKRPEEIVESWRRKTFDTVVEISKQLEALIKTNAPIVLFSFDEVRQLFSPTELVSSAPKDLLAGEKGDVRLSRFSLLRLAMQILPYNADAGVAQTFCVLSDTTSKISNYAPADRLDVSRRPQPPHSLQKGLLDPFTLVMTLDLWWQSVRSLSVSTDKSAPEILDKIAEIVLPKPVPQDGQEVRGKESEDLVEGPRLSLVPPACIRSELKDQLVHDTWESAVDYSLELRRDELGTVVPPHFQSTAPDTKSRDNSLEFFDDRLDTCTGKTNVPEVSKLSSRLTLSLIDTFPFMTLFGRPFFAPFYLARLALGTLNASSKSSVKSSAEGSPEGSSESSPTDSSESSSEKSLEGSLKGSPTVPLEVSHKGSPKVPIEGSPEGSSDGSFTVPQDSAKSSAKECPTGPPQGSPKDSLKGSLNGSPEGCSQSSLKSSHPIAQQEAAKALLDLVKRKLLHIPMAREWSTLGRDFSPAQAVAVLGNLVAVEVAAGTDLASELTASHLWPVAGISGNREKVYTLQTAEPVIALAAREIVMKEIVPMNELIDKFADQLRSSTSPGYRGELAMQVLCILAAQEVRKKKGLDAFDALPAMAFIEALFGDKLTNAGIEADTLLRQSSFGKENLRDLAKLCREFKPQKRHLQTLQFLSGLGSSTEVTKAFGNQRTLLQKLLLLDETVFTSLSAIADVTKFEIPASLQLLRALAKSPQQRTKKDNGQIDLQLKSGANPDSEVIRELEKAYSLNVLSSVLKVICAFKIDDIDRWEDLQILAKSGLSPGEIGRLVDLVRKHAGDSEAADTLSNTVQAAEFVETLTELKKALEHAFVRLNEFVKTFSDVSGEMLFDAFLRGAGIACKEFQQVVDLVIPVFFANVSDKQPDPRNSQITSDRIGLFLFQVKHQFDPISPTKKAGWLRKVRSMSIVTQAGAAGLPCVAIFNEFSARSNSFHVETDLIEQPVKLGKRSRIAGAGREKVIALFSSGLNACHINNDKYKTVDESLGRLLETGLNPSRSTEIPTETSSQIAHMFKGITYR